MTLVPLRKPLPCSLPLQFNAAETTQAGILQRDAETPERHLFLEWGRSVSEDRQDSVIGFCVL